MSQTLESVFKTTLVACICQTVLLILFLIFKTTLAIWQIASLEGHNWQIASYHSPNWQIASYHSPNWQFASYNSNNWQFASHDSPNWQIAR